MLTKQKQQTNPNITTQMNPRITEDILGDADINKK